MASFRERYGEWALVTGASSGMGAEFARQLAARGMNVILVARRKKLLQEVAEEVEKNYGVKTLVIQQDLAQRDFLRPLVKKVGKREVGVLVNNAGYGFVGKFEEQPAERDAGMVRLNCVAPTMLTHQFLPQMLGRKKGAVIFLASTAAYQPLPFIATYSATKAFNLFLGEALWYELKERGVDALALSPGGTRTEFHRNAGAKEYFGREEPEKVVRAALEALGKEPSVVRGFLHKMAPLWLKLLSRKSVLEAAAQVGRRLSRKGI